MKLYSNENDVEAESRREARRYMTSKTFSRVVNEMKEKKLVLKIDEHERNDFATQKMMCRKCIIWNKKEWCSC